MYYLIYISTSVKTMEQADLLALLAESRKKNSEINITGLLMYSNGTFIQVLEGEQDAVEYLYAAIQRDTRHKNLIEIVTGEQENRTFPDWQMAFLLTEPAKMDEIIGYINPLKTKIFNGEQENTTLTVLKTFADNNDLTY